jgi:ketosteroid isomerase-like protein
MSKPLLKGETGTAGDLEVLTRLNLEYVRSVEEANVGWFDRHLAPDFMNSNPDASIVDRAGFLAQIARGSGVTDIRAEDVLIRITGDLAIIHARTVYKKPDGKTGSGRYTDIWSRRQGRWLCVAAHVARG